MPTTFRLKHPQTGIPAKDQRPTPIELTYHFGGQRMRYGVGESIHPRDWNPKTQRPRTSAPNSASLTRLLDNLETRVRDLHLGLRADFAAVSPSILKQTLQRDTMTGGRKETLVQYFERYVQQKSEHHGPGTMGPYNSALRQLKRYPFAKEFNDISPEWFDRYATWMQNYRDSNVTDKSKDFKTLGYSQNYIAKQIGVIREVMAAARKEGLHRNERYMEDNYKVAYEDTDAIYLTQDELSALHRVELPPYLDHVRNRFLIGAFTLLRFSDFSKITAQNIRDGMVHNKNQKTGTSVVVPQHWIVGEILAKYQDGIPPACSNQKTNEYIKEACRRAGITTPVTIHKTHGGKVVASVHDKCDLVTTHTARRSGACNMELSGIPRQIIMAMGGWKTEGAYLHYIRYKSVDSARVAQDYAFFTKPTAPAVVQSP